MHPVLAARNQIVKGRATVRRFYPKAVELKRKMKDIDASMKRTASIRKSSCATRRGTPAKFD